MSAKKIIAICQSGVEFVGNQDDGSLSYSDGDAYALDLDHHAHLEDFKQELAETLQCSVNGMTIKYFPPKNRKTLITISKDKDLKRMFNFFNQVEVFVIAEEEPAAMPASRSRRTTLSEAVVTPGDLIHTAEPMGVEATPLDFYPSINDDDKHRRAALQWENTISGVDKRFNTFAEFRQALHRYSIAHGFSYKYKKIDSHRVTAKCK